MHEHAIARARLNVIGFEKLATALEQNDRQLLEEGNALLIDGMPNGSSGRPVPPSCDGNRALQADGVQTGGVQTGGKAAPVPPGVGDLKKWPLINTCQ